MIAVGELEGGLKPTWRVVIYHYIFDIDHMVQTILEDTLRVWILFEPFPRTAFKSVLFLHQFFVPRFLWNKSWLNESQWGQMPIKISLVLFLRHHDAIIVVLED